MRITPSCGRERVRWKTWGRIDAKISRLKVINLIEGELGDFKFNSFRPKKSTAMKSATHPVSINRSETELTYKDFVEAVGAEP
jgi:hypothetical protein